MASFPTSSPPATRAKRARIANGETRTIGAFFKAASARNLIGCFSGPVDLAESHGTYLKTKLRGGKKSSR